MHSNGMSGAYRCTRPHSPPPRDSTGKKPDESMERQQGRWLCAEHNVCCTQDATIPSLHRIARCNPPSRGICNRYLWLLYFSNAAPCFASLRSGIRTLHLCLAGVSGQDYPTPVTVPPNSPHGRQARLGHGHEVYLSMEYDGVQAEKQSSHHPFSMLSPTIPPTDRHIYIYNKAGIYLPCNIQVHPSSNIYTNLPISHCLWCGLQPVASTYARRSSPPHSAQI